MTDEGINKLKDLRKEYEFLAKYNGGEDYIAFKALDMAVKELSHSEKPNKCEDCISRADAISLFKEDVAAVNELKYLVPVTPKPKMGRWIRKKKHHKDDFQEFDYWDVRCSECGARKRIGWTNVRHCPMCGAKMEGGVV